MDIPKTNTLAGKIRDLEKEGYMEQFIAKSDFVLGIRNKKEYKPKELSIVKKYRFEGMSNPSDSSELLAIKAEDGTKGTLSYSYSAKQSHNEEMLKKISNSTT